MNTKRLLLAIPIVFVGIFASDFLIHGVWLKNDYAASASLWRPEAEMQKFMGWLMLGQLLAAITATTLYAKGFADKACAMCAMMFGLFMSLFMQANTLINYAVMPLPGHIAVKWFVAGAGQGVLLGLLMFAVYKPKAGANCGGSSSP
jgi:Na+-transporting methylmalonyl-CoA/oxaloacetate decarboxylase beta subunit